MASRARKLQLGQTWSATFTDKTSRITGYQFKIVYEDSYICRETWSRRKCWLGLKINVSVSPINEGGSQSWWFDDRGVCTDTLGNFKFILTRKRT